MSGSRRAGVARVAWARLARTVDRLIGALGYEAVDVLGVSFGGALAQQLVRQSPDRVRRLVLAATAPGVPGLGGVPGRPSAMLTLATPLRYYSPAYFRKVAPTLYGGRIRREPELLAEQAHARMTRPPSLRGYVAQLYAMSVVDQLSVVAVHPTIPRSSWQATTIRSSRWSTGASWRG